MTIAHDKSIGISLLHQERLVNGQPQECALAAWWCQEAQLYGVPAAWQVRFCAGRSRTQHCAADSARHDLSTAQLKRGLKVVLHSQLMLWQAAQHWPLMQVASQKALTHKRTQKALTHNAPRKREQRARPGRCHAKM